MTASGTRLMVNGQRGGEYRSLDVEFAAVKRHIAELAAGEVDRCDSPGAGA
jgi:hypothetical protein